MKMMMTMKSSAIEEKKNNDYLAKKNRMEIQKHQNIRTGSSHSIQFFLSTNNSM